MSDISRIFVIGGTGAQGLPVVKGLVSDGRYAVLALTRDSCSPRASQLAAMGNVSFLEGTFADEAMLREGMRACEGVFINLDGFNAGEKTEMFWAIRAYEIALEEGVRFLVYGNLDYTLKKAGYRSEFRTGHYDGKGRIGEWILNQNRSNGHRMGAALFTSGPYIEMAFSAGTPMTPRMENGVLTWRVPLGEGRVVHVALDDCAYYVRWLFDHPERANGMDLEVAIEHVGYADLAAAFERVTGHPARYIDTDLDTYFASIPTIAAQPAGYNADPADKSTMSFRENFTGFWNQWKHDVITRDYALLDEIHPGRIRSAENWIRRHEQRAREEGTETLWERVQPGTITNRRILKLSEDQRRGAI
ncbi:NmrA family NAD(P)-binding protein [Sphingomonas oryzagri]|uniref:NmrA family NAD(P)-binding protein n=1 Tax=Sphingomonas oryzagri TaxID=3042314 RepID=A0ABT6N5N9_9SPHN|nr:NmrA family NAD(P)-binding protein [Sphingomonas oryzagri]MDH7640417.1 NmrA family NAD(P)-binding protein [Sphingomonas oryzagri]